MKPISISIVAGLAAVALPLPSHAADIAWGSATPIVNSTDIQSTGVTNLEGADFGLTNGTTTTVNNGSVNVDFKSLLFNQAVTLTNGITVTPTNFSFDNGAGNGTIGGAYGTFLGRHSGVFSNGGTVVLTGLAVNTQYQIQVFAMGGDTSTVSIAGSPGLSVGGGNNAGNSSGFGAFAVGTFTADATSQVLSLTANTGEPVINALTIGTVSGGGPDVTPPEWTTTWPQVHPLSSTSLDVRAKTNEAGAAYCVVLPDGAPAPNAGQVKAGTDSSNTPVASSGSMVLTANTEASATVDGLTAGTNYDVYFVAEDTVPNLQAAPFLVTISLIKPAVAWSDWTDVADNTAIHVLGGYSTAKGVNFNGSDTTINNGTVDVSFVGIGQNASGTAAGITVSTSGFDFQSTGSGNSNVASAVGSPQTWGAVLDRVIGDFGSGATATFTLSGLTPGSSYYVQFFSSAPDGNILSNSKITSRGVDSPFFGSHPGGGTKSIIATFTADGTSQAFTISGSEPTYSALVIGVQPAGGGNTYASWIGGFSNLNGLTGFNDDADFDGLDNGLENFLGTAPNAGNAGLVGGALSGNTFTLAHPQNATPASDVSAPAYTWSTDLQTFHASGASADGITVNLVAVSNTPSVGTTTVTATVTGTVPSQLFVRLGVSQL